MKASDRVKELQHIIDTDGDHQINISCAKPANESAAEKEQRYLMSAPAFVVLDEYDDHKEISIRDWPY